MKPSEDSRKPLLADFGVGKRLNAPCDRNEESESLRGSQDALKTHTQQIGTLGYSAPEVFSEQGHSFAADVWSFGAMIYVLLCGYHPFDMGDDADDVIQVKLLLLLCKHDASAGASAEGAGAADGGGELVCGLGRGEGFCVCLSDGGRWKEDFMDVVELVDAFGRLQFYHNSRRESRNQAAAQTATRVKRKREASVASDEGSAGSLTPTPSKNLKSISRPLPTTAEACVHEGFEPFSEEDVESVMADPREVWLTKTRLDHEKRERKRVHAEKAGGLQTCPEVAPPSNSLAQQEGRVELSRDEEGEGVREMSLRDQPKGSEAASYAQEARREKKPTAKGRNKLKPSTADSKKDNLTSEFDKFCTVEGLATSSTGSLPTLTQEEAVGRSPACSRQSNPLHSSESLLSELHIEDGDRSDIADSLRDETVHAERPAAKRRTNSEAPVPDSSPQLQPLIVELKIFEGEAAGAELQLEKRRPSLGSELIENSLGVQLESQLELLASSDDMQRRKRERSEDWANLDAARITDKDT
eukprot:751711-Hanusia_phi.AAC.3